MNYDSWLPFLGDGSFSVRQVPELVGETVTVEGWHFRGRSTWPALRWLVAGEREVGGFTHLDSDAVGGLAVVLGVAVLLLPLVRRPGASTLYPLRLHPSGMRLELDVSGELVQLAVGRTVNAGYSGRDEEAVQEHVDELVADGVVAPEQVPATYAVAPNSLRADPDTIRVVGDDTSGEAEFGLVVAGGETYVVAASDHTDRALERESIQKAKQIAPNALSRNAWRFSEVRSHWDELELRAWVTVDGEHRRYQADTLAALLAPEEIIEVVRGRYGEVAGGEVVLSGTVATLGGDVQPGSRFEVELLDPVRDRSLSVGYDVETL